VREAHGNPDKTETRTSEGHHPRVQIQELREAERLFHLHQEVVEESRSVRRRRRSIDRVRQVAPQSIRRITAQYKGRYRDTHSRSR